LKFSNLVVIIVDSLRWDYFLKSDIRGLMNPSVTFKCTVTEPYTSASVPILLTGKKFPKKKLLMRTGSFDGLMDLTEVVDKTLFDYFKDLNYVVQYINVDPYDELWKAKQQSFFPSFPSGYTLEQLMPYNPKCLVFHFWDVHYPYLRYDLTKIQLQKRYDLPQLYKKSIDHFTQNHLKPLLKLFKDTLFVLTSDHGEMLGEQNRFFHKHPLTTLLKEVPLLFYPLNRHEVCSEVLKQTQILSTILDMFQIRHNLEGSVCGRLA